MTTPDTTTRQFHGLAARLGMPEGAQNRIDHLPEAARVELPAAEHARSLMEYCSVSEPNQEAMLTARPDPVEHPDWWLLVLGTVAELRQRMDQPLPPLGYQSWPTVPEDSGPIGMFAYAWALLAVVPDLMAVHQRRGIPESITRATLDDLGGVMTTHAEVTGQRGVGLFPLWGPPQSFCGIDLTVGRHSFSRTHMAFGDGPDGYALQVHIPPTGPLDEQESLDSIDQALAFFARHYPDEPISALVCRSWILDPQLADHLSSGSNLLRFARRWSLLPLIPDADPWEGDRELMRLGLQLRTPDSGPLTKENLDSIPQQTSLQRGFVALIRAGGHWHKRTGVQWLGA